MIALLLTACGLVVRGEVPEPRATSERDLSLAVPGHLVPTPRPLAVVPAGTPTVHAAADPSGVVIVASEGDQSLALVDAATNQVAKNIHLGIVPSAIAVEPGAQRAWVFSARPRESDFYLVDLEKGARQGANRLREGPAAVAFSGDGDRAFVALREGNAVAFLTRTNRAEFGQVELGRQTQGVQIRRAPRALAVAPGAAGEVLYVAGYGGGVVWALDAGSGQLLAEIAVGGGPLALLVPPSSTPGSGRVYVVVDTLDLLVVVDPTHHALVDRLRLPGHPTAAALGPDGIVYVASADAGEVWMIDPVAGAIVGRLAIGLHPVGVAVSDDGSRLYVTRRDDGTLAVVDLPTRQVVATVPVGDDPGAVAYAARVAPGTPTPVPTPTPTTRATPTRTPTMAPTATALPPNARPPEHLPPGTVKEVFVPGAQFPTALAFAPDGRLFYAEYRTGRIRIVENGVLRPEPFYDFAVAGQPETGLIGLALDPNFAQNHYVYAFYTATAGTDAEDGGGNGPNHVVRLTEVDGRGTDLTPILSDLPSGQIHNAGSLRFGPDGMLYVTLGETGDMDLADDLSSPAGKILRVRPDGSIPPDNPYVGQAGKHPAIWAAGFRNPFDLDFHPVNGVVIAGESGPGDNDELNLVVRGGNYGWPPSGFQDKPDRIDPLATFNPVISPVGMEFYRGDQIAEWRHDLFFCNFHQGQLRRIRLAPDSFDRIVLEEVVAYGCTLDVTTGPDGALYYSDVNRISRIRRNDAPGLPLVAEPESPGGSPTATLPPGALPQDRDVNVNLTEWAILPSRTEVPAGRVRVLAENLGATIHSLRIVGPGVDVQTDDFGPGASRLLEVDLEPGVYELTCPISGHTELGMHATLTVQ